MLPMCNNFRVSRAAAWVLAVALLACAGCEETARRGEAEGLACVPARGTAQVKTELYFGLSKPDGGSVSEAEWTAFLDREITPRFKDGLTVLNADGQWLGKDAKVLKEKSKLVILIHEDQAEKGRAIEEIIARYQEAFHQESVLRVTRRVNAAF
jgi:hypothetical protein